MEILLCVGPKGAEVPLTKQLERAAGQPDAHLAAVPMTRDEFAAWPRKDIYGGRLAVVYLLPPIMLSMVFVAMLAGGGYFLDQNRPEVPFRAALYQRSGDCASEGISQTCEA